MSFMISYNCYKIYCYYCFIFLLLCISTYKFYYIYMTYYFMLIAFRFIVPVSMIVINDVMAYMFGFFFGRTPLIKLSPKKTWEGFIGGGISTVILGLLVIKFHKIENGNSISHMLIQYFLDIIC